MEQEKCNTLSVQQDEKCELWKMEAGFEKRVEECEEQERTSKEVDTDYKVSKEGVVIIDKRETAGKQWSGTSCWTSTTQKWSK